MKRIFLLGIFIVCAVMVRAQQHYFAYFQTDNHQPFFVKMNNTVLSSSASGYLIIPKLQNGEYPLTIGFPKSEKAEQRFGVTINGKDLGFLVKDFGDKGWGLFNFQTMKVVMASGPSLPAKGKDTATDAFSNILANVVNTPSIKEKTIKAEEPKSRLPEETPKTDTITKVITVKEETVSLPTKTSPGEVSIKKDNPVVLYQAISELGGKSMIYLVKESDKYDTIRVYLPVISVNEKAETFKKDQKRTEAVKQNDSKIPDEKFLPIELPNPNSESAVTQQVKAEPSSVITSDGKLNYNSDCKTTASQDDFIELRRRMVAQESENAMIREAQKIFKQKCFSTDQVKGLSSLILSEKNKMDFFKMTYPFVYDSSNFHTLQSQLTEEIYINSFKAMLIK